MEKDEKYYQLLLERWFQNQSTPEESIEIMEYLKKDASGRMMLKNLQYAFSASMEQPSEMDTAISDRVRNALLKNIETDTPGNFSKNTNRFNWLRLAAAAVVVIGLGVSAYFLIAKNDPEKELVKTIHPAQLKNDISAGKYKAVLTLANGKKIVLDSAAEGHLAEQGNSAVINAGGQLLYNQQTGNAVEVVYNTLTTARGESYPLVLADGSKLWLNASSSVRFPTSFTGNERSIEITGEVYFEIAKDKDRPFRVKTNDMLVEVLGTHFDVNSYPDESAITTTLLEGAVKIYGKNGTLRLSPGQQSQLQPGGHLKLVKEVYTDEIIAWKDGYFHFESAGLESILRQFSRWYDVQVVYEGKIKPVRYFGIISRSSTLSTVLKMLENNGVQFRIEGKKLIVQSG